MAGSPAPLLRERGAGGRPGRCGAPGGGPRQSASEREKLRMRQLARALRTLRLYLPPALAPAGQSLTKVETLRLAARYIGHLSALLGLSEEALARRRGAAARRCPLCPPGLGCCRPPPPPPPTSPPGAWGSPLYGPAAGAPPELDGAPGVGTSTWGSLPYGPMAGSPPELDGALIIDASSWLPPPHCAGAGSPPELDGAPGVGTSTWGLLHCSPVAGTPLELDGAPSMGTGTWGSLPCGPAAGTPPELLGTPGSDSGSWLSSLRGLGAATPLDPPRRRDAVTGTGTVSSSCAEPAAPRAAVTDTGPRGPPTHGSQLDARYQLGSPQALDPLVTPGTQGAAGPPGCAPARCWGWWS